MKPKVAAILLMLSLIAPLLAAFSYLHYQKKSVRKVVKHQLMTSVNKDELVLLKFTEEESKAKLRWKHSREFEYNKQMYDIVSKEAKGDTTWYWCWLDHAETRLNDQLDDLVASMLSQNPQNRERQKKLIEYLKKLYYVAYSAPLSQPTGTIITSYRTVDSCSVFYHAPPFPPPRFG